MADIGTDHGILPIYLCLNHRINQAYACDIAPKSLNKAIEKIKKYHLEKQITPLLGDGRKCFINQLNPLSLLDGRTFNDQNFK